MVAPLILIGAWMLLGIGASCIACRISSIERRRAAAASEQPPPDSCCNACRPNSCKIEKDECLVCNAPMLFEWVEDSYSPEFAEELVTEVAFPSTARCMMYSMLALLPVALVMLAGPLLAWPLQVANYLACKARCGAAT